MITGQNRLYLDTRCEQVRHEGQIVDFAVLIAVSVTDDGTKRRMLGVSVVLSESEVHTDVVFIENLMG